MAKKVTKWEDIGGGIHELLEDCNAADIRIRVEQSLGSIVEDIHSYNQTRVELVAELINYRNELLDAFCGTDPGEFKDSGNTLIYNGETRELADLSDVVDSMGKMQSMVITKTAKNHLWIRHLFMEKAK